MNRYSFGSLQIPTNPYPADHGVVMGSVPALDFDDAPQVLYISEAAKNVQFQIDPTARRVVVYPSGRVDHEY